MNFYIDKFKQLNKKMYDPTKMNMLITNLYDLIDIQKSNQKRDINKEKEVKKLIFSYVLSDIDSKEKLNKEIKDVYNIIKVNSPVLVNNIDEAIKKFNNIDQTNNIDIATKVKQYCEVILSYLQNSSKTYTKIMLNSAYIETLMEEKILIES